MPRIRIVIAEDETMTRVLLARWLEGVPDFEILGQAENGKQASEMVEALRPDVLVTDLNMPGLNGIEVIERVAARVPHTKTILLTALGDLAALGKNVGAFATLNKRSTPEELIAAIRRTQEVREDAEPRTDHDARLRKIATRGGLTERESAVLRKALDAELTVSHIASSLSQETGETFTHSGVKHTLERVMGKLRVEPRTRAALVKYVLEERG